MAMKKNMLMGDEVVADVGFSGAGLREEPKVEYPYCLKLYLSQDELNMLGIDKLPEVGTTIPMKATVKVMSTRLDEAMGKTMELQIIEMELGKDKEEPKDYAKEIYGNTEG